MNDISISDSLYDTVLELNATEKNIIGAVELEGRSLAAAGGKNTERTTQIYML